MHISELYVPVWTFHIIRDFSNHAGEDTCGPFYYHWLTLISAWISNYTHYNVWDEITYPFLNFNGAIVEVQEWISTFIPHFSGACDYLSMLGLKLNHVNKRGSRRSLCINKWKVFIHTSYHKARWGGNYDSPDNVIRRQIPNKSPMKSNVVNTMKFPQ